MTCNCSDGPLIETVYGDDVTGERFRHPEIALPCAKDLITDAPHCEISSEYIGKLAEMARQFYGAGCAIYADDRKTECPHERRPQPPQLILEKRHAAP